LWWVFLNLKFNELDKMRIVIQRVSEASVKINSVRTGQIGKGLLVLVGIENNDSREDIDWLIKKILNLRIFNDEKETMNKSLMEVDGDILLVSQFTLHASTKKGNRPSYIKAAKADIAIPLYQQFIELLEDSLGKSISTGTFGANMQVALVNDGPVTIIIDSKNRI
jgi:D-tyrosyl-tRNA(Tyr) deacylase